MSIHCLTAQECKEWGTMVLIYGLSLFFLGVSDFNEFNVDNERGVFKSGCCEYSYSKEPV